MANQDPTIGKLNRRITIGRRDRVNNTSDSGTHEVITAFADVWASINPLGTALMIDSIQVDPPNVVTHRIAMYWLNFTSEFDVIKHQRIMPDRTIRTETFKIVRVTEWQGNRVFMLIDARLEKIE